MFEATRPAFTCTCGITTVAEFPVRCACGRVYIAADNVDESSLVPIEHSVQVVTHEDTERALQRFRDHWTKLHLHVRTREDYEQWVLDVPTFGCSCVTHWKQLVGEPTDEQLANPWWGFEMHNAVRQKLGQEVFSREEAAELYGW